MKLSVKYYNILIFIIILMLPIANWAAIIEDHVKSILGDVYEPKISLINNILGKDNDNDDTFLKTAYEHPNKYLIKPIMTLVSENLSHDIPLRHGISEILRQVRFIFNQIAKMNEVDIKLPQHSAIVYTAASSDAALLFDIIKCVQPKNKLHFRLLAKDDVMYRFLNNASDFYKNYFVDHKLNDSDPQVTKYIISTSISPLQMLSKESSTYFWVDNSTAASVPIYQVLNPFLKSTMNESEFMKKIDSLKKLSAERGGVMYQMVFDDVQDLNEFAWPARQFGKKIEVPGLVGQVIFPRAELGEALKLLRQNFKEFLTRFSINTEDMEVVRELKGFQGRIYIHPRLQEKNITVYEYNSRPIEENKQFLYQKTLKEFCINHMQIE